MQVLDLSPRHFPAREVSKNRIKRKDPARGLPRTKASPPCVDPEMVEITSGSSAGLLAARLGLEPGQVRLEDAAIKSAISTFTALPGDTSANISYGEKTYLLLRDSINEFNSLVSLVQIKSSDLEGLADYLSQIQVLEARISDASSAEELDATFQEIEALESAMSSFLANKTSFSGDMTLALSFEGSFQKKYFESLSTEGTLLADYAADIAMVEVDISQLFTSKHMASTCPICQAAIAAEMGGTDAFFSEAPAQVSTNVTGATTIGASGTSYIEALRGGVKWDLTTGETLSYSYYNGAVGYDSAAYSSLTYNAPLGATAISSTNQTYKDQAFTAWDNAAAFSFEKVTESGSTVGEIRSAYTTRTYASASSAAYAYFPNSGVVGGDIWYINDQATNLDFAPGGYGYYTALHEIGHALGLSHTFGDSTSATNASLSTADDIQRNSVMTYTQYDRNQYWTQNGTTISANYFYATTPGLYDVAAMEYIYGANSSTNTTNTVHQFTNWTASAPLYFQTIVDTGGADTFDASAQTRASVINLTPGTFSSVGLFTEAQQEAYWSGVLGGVVDIPSSTISSGSGTGVASRSVLYTGADNVGIAFSATIENAIGGAGNDTITGNTANNAIKGGLGNDTIDGGSGTDTAVFAGAKADYTITGLGTATITVVDSNAADGDEGTDTLTNIQFLEFSDLTVDTSDATGATTTSTGTGAIASATAGAAVASSGGTIVGVNLDQVSNVSNIVQESQSAAVTYGQLVMQFAYQGTTPSIFNARLDDNTQGLYTNIDPDWAQGTNVTSKVNIDLTTFIYGGNNDVFFGLGQGKLTIDPGGLAPLDSIDIEYTGDVFPFDAIYINYEKTNDKYTIVSVGSNSSGVTAISASFSSTGTNTNVAASSSPSLVIPTKEGTFSAKRQAARLQQAREALNAGRLVLPPRPLSAKAKYLSRLAEARQKQFGKDDEVTVTQALQSAGGASVALSPGHLKGQNPPSSSQIAAAVRVTATQKAVLAGIQATLANQVRAILGEGNLSVPKPNEIVQTIKLLNSPNPIALKAITAPEVRAMLR